MTSLRDVARVAGVSMKTVSRVVNNDPKVAPATRQRVQQVIEEMNYRPNLLARGLANGKTSTAGIVINLTADDVFGYPLFSDSLRGIAEALNNRLDMLLHLGHGKFPYLDLFHRHRVDGLILMNIPMDDPNLRGLLDSGLPCVFTCRLAADETRANWVDPDFASGAEQVIDHLVALGHTRIGVLAGPNHLFSAHERVRGVREGLKRYGLELDERLVCYGELFTGSGRRLAKHIMAQPDPPTALICSDDLMACEAIYALHELGYDVPDDVSVVGWDDSSLAPVFRPPLTSVRQDAYQKGALAAKRLLQLIAATDPEPPQQTLLPMSLIIRESTARVNQRRENYSAQQVAKTGS
ncbi:MAG: LacI family DNA-binding transcriptional regulator [Chloroflexota bacterium]